uniref:Candidate secreted effector n=1 Tax=Meloidogyne incognita TaxID=6306 RepID=A0A914MNF3_MELIC
MKEMNSCSEHFAGGVSGTQLTVKTKSFFPKQLRSESDNGMGTTSAPPTSGGGC